MALKPPGSRSNLQLLLTLVWTGAMLTILIGGHVVIGYLLLSAMTDGGGMKAVQALTQLPAWTIWLWMVAAVALDGWIVWHARKQRRKDLER